MYVSAGVRRQITIFVAQDWSEWYLYIFFIK